VIDKNCSRLVALGGETALELGNETCLSTFHLVG
jgi:hypothetical protein